MANEQEYNGMSEDQKKDFKLYMACLQESKNFTKPHFDRFVRMYRLFRGYLPPELDTTYSKIMLYEAFAIVDREIPKMCRSVMSTPNWFDLKARRPEVETVTSQSKDWVKYQVEDIQRIPAQITTLGQFVGIFGVAYGLYETRPETFETKKLAYDNVMGMPTNVRYVTKQNKITRIVSNYLNVFNVLPSPTGVNINSPDKLSENNVDYLIVNTYPKKSWIQIQADDGKFDKGQVAKLFEKKNWKDSADYSREYKDKMLETGEWKNFGMPDWIRKTQDIGENYDSRYRVTWLMYPDKHIAIGQDCTVLFSGKPDVYCIPVSKWTATPDTDKFFGFGLIEIAEDLLLSKALGLNHRMDYLAGTLHPATFVPKELLEDLGNDRSLLDNPPYGIVPYDHTRFPNGIQNSVWRDRFPELNRQAFIEDDKMQALIEDITGQPGMLKGMRESGAGDIGATGVVSLISQGADRQSTRAYNIEETGVKDSILLTLKFGKKYAPNPDTIRTSESQGYPWRSIDKDAIVDEFDVSVTGTRNVNLRDQMLKNMMAVSQILLQMPEVKGRKEIAKALVEKSGGFDDPRKIIDGEFSEPGEMITGGIAGMVQPGGVNSPMNEMRSMSNRSQPTAGGETEPAGSIDV